MGVRMMAASVVTVAMLPIAGWLIESIGGVQGYQATLVIAGVLGFRPRAFTRASPKFAARRARACPQAASLRASRPLPAIVALSSLCHQLCLDAGIQISGPFFSVHMVENLGFGVDTIALLATIVTIFNVFAVRFAGTLVDRKGAERMTAIGMLLVPLMPWPGCWRARRSR